MKETKQNKWILPVFWVFSLLYLEVLVHIGMYHHFQPAFGFALGFSGVIGIAVGLLFGLLPGAALFPVSLAASVLLAVVYGSQLVYCFIFGTPYSVSQMGMGGDAITSFWMETVSTIGGHFLWILGLMVPCALLIVLHHKKALCRSAWKQSFILTAAALILFAVTLGSIRAGGTDMYSNYYFLTSPKSTTTQTMERFGVPATFYLELTHTDSPEEEVILPVMIPETTVPPETIPAAAPEAEEIVPEPTRYNMLELDFDALNADTDSQQLINLNNYCAQMPATNQNAYTGMLRDYNLIVICAESFSPAAVDPQVTPTLYKLTHEGFLFRNFYNSFPNTTIDGEYSLCQGLFPDSVRGKEDSSMLISSGHKVPFTIANSFKQQLGVSSWGYHNNYATYYGRDKSHPNMGYSMKFTGRGMTFTNAWPSSDLEMMEQSVDDFIHEKQFHAYYMTFSGHYKYDPEINGIARKNFGLVEDLEQYSYAQKAYLACHIELDKALEYLLQRLEEEGIAEKTAIVMAGDHFPYGLVPSQYFGMIGQPEDFFTMYKSDLAFWVGGMEEPIEVSEYCCNVDILPTILNLWGIEYDSRLLAGTDVFSDGPHIAVLIDHSFLTDQAWFNSNTGEIRWQISEALAPYNYINNMNQFIASRFNFSAQVLRNDYYRYLFG